MAAFPDDDLSFFLAYSFSVPMNTSNNNDDMSTLLSDQQSFTSHHLMSSHESLQEIPLPAPRIQYETSSLHQSCCSMQLPCSFTTGFSIAAKPELISSPPPAMASDLVISTDDRHQGKELNPQTEKKRKNNMKREGEDEFEKQSNKRYRKRQKKVAEAATSTGYVHVRARRGEATDSHSLAERVRRRKISARMKLLQSLVPGCDQLTGKALILDEIIKYVQALQTQVQYLADKLASVNPMLNKDLGPNFIDPADKLPVNENDNNILQSSMDISKIQGSANQFGLDDLCSLW